MRSVAERSRTPLHSADAVPSRQASQGVSFQLSGPSFGKSGASGAMADRRAGKVVDRRRGGDAMARPIRPVVPENPLQTPRAAASAPRGAGQRRRLRGLGPRLEGGRGDQLRVAPCWRAPAWPDRGHGVSRAQPQVSVEAPLRPRPRSRCRRGIRRSCGRSGPSGCSPPCPRWHIAPATARPSPSGRRRDQEGRSPFRH